MNEKAILESIVPDGNEEIFGIIEDDINIQKPKLMNMNKLVFSVKYARAGSTIKPFAIGVNELGSAFKTKAGSDPKVFLTLTADVIKKIESTINSQVKVPIKFDSSAYNKQIEIKNPEVELNIKDDIVYVA